MKKSLVITCKAIEELPGAASEILHFAGDVKVLLFFAPMGAGKTTLIKEICRKLGSDDNFSSPTYSIINEYGYPGGKIYHIDLYRLKDATELLDLGMEEYLQSGNYCFFEWPELALDLVPSSYINVKIELKGETREIHLRNEQ